MYSQKAMSRKKLLDIIRNNFPAENRVQIARRLESILDETYELKEAEGKAYNAKGRLIPKLIIRKYWKDQKRQRRLITLTHPSTERQRGRPKLRWPRYLIASLGREYMLQTGQLPTSGAWRTPSDFERFVGPILFAFAVFDARHLVKEYLRERTKNNPWPVGQV